MRPHPFGSAEPARAAGAWPRAAARTLLAAAIGWAAGPAPGHAAVELSPVPGSSRWPGAVEEGAVKLACGASPAEIEAFFRRERVPFRPDLLRAGRDPCHVFYRPTVPGFRASPDDDPLREILYDADPLIFLGPGRVNRGDSVGAMTEVLRRIDRPLDVGVVLHRVHESAAYERAVARRFGVTPHRVKLRDRGVDRNFWWVQDYVKAGASGRGETLLVPHRLFEGRPENATVFDSLLERLSEDESAVRSRLSWEGGDLQFTRAPGDPERLVLYYGTFAKAYWGESLSAEEFEYVLSLEFGADQAIDLGGLAPHVDYFVSFLPRVRTALVSVPRSGDLDLARAVIESLLGILAGDGPPVLLDLRETLRSPGPSPSEIVRLVRRAREEQGGWSLRIDEGLPARTKELVSRVCPDRDDCFTTEDQARLAEADPALFEEWIHAVQRAREEQAIVSAHLDLVESQLEPVPGEIERRTLEKIAELEGIGFRVIRVPAFRVNLAHERDWPGISYVNALVVDQRVFVPAFGLGEVEDRIFGEVSAQLPAGYSVVPIPAQRVLIRNGGLHCLAGLIR